VVDGVAATKDQEVLMVAAVLLIHQELLDLVVEEESYTMATLMVEGVVLQVNQAELN
tara:strand:- start:232 stop:402 length:171 start_codon:yes stop_codon:yes gene_type:complete